MRLSVLACKTSWCNRVCSPRLSDRWRACSVDSARSSLLLLPAAVFSQRLSLVSTFERIEIGFQRIACEKLDGAKNSSIRPSIRILRLTYTSSFAFATFSPYLSSCTRTSWLPSPCVVAWIPPQPTIVPLTIRKQYYSPPVTPAIPSSRFGRIPIPDRLRTT